MGKLETSGYRRFWPMRQFERVDSSGKKVSTEGYRDMVSGKFYAPEKGWNGSPPNLPPGNRNLTDPSRKYMENYERIFGHS
jgi:hypothetical protein